MFNVTGCLVGHLSSSVYGYNRNNTTEETGGELMELGRCGFRVGKYFISPNTQFATGGRAPDVNVVIEAGMFQSVGSLLIKVREYLNHSNNNLMVFVVKIWYDPLPSKFAAVAALWSKLGRTVQDSDRQAVQFVSFGNRPPTEEELADFQESAGLGVWAPPLTGVTGTPNHLPCFEENQSHPVFEVRLPVLFAEPGLVGPNPHFALPDLVFQLARTKQIIMMFIANDIIFRICKLNRVQLLEIINDADLRASQPRLHEFVTKELELWATSHV